MAHWRRGGVSVVGDFGLTPAVMNFTQFKTLTFADLTMTDRTDGAVLLSWTSGRIDVSDILISLRIVPKCGSCGR